MKPNNFDDYQAKLDAVKLDASRKNLKPFPDDYTLEQMIIHSIAEGNVLLIIKSAAPTQPPKVLDNALAKMSDNPYIRARAEVLKKMIPSLRKQIEEMEKTKNLDNRIYKDFVQEVRKLGDSFSSSN